MQTVRKRSASKAPTFDAVIFDIDNVLIDTRKSYLDAIRWTVDIFLTAGKIPYFVAKQGASGPQILTPEDVDTFKLLGGFNDDWDCCYGLLVYLLNLPVKKHTVASLKSVMDITGFAKKIRKKPLGVGGVIKRLGRPKHIRIEKISRIFQEIYLGHDLFRMAQRIEPVYWKKKGLIQKEKPIFRPSTLERLKRLDIKLGIATGRPRFEAMLSLKRFDMLEFFDSIVTINEVKKAEQKMKRSLRKPHPFSLLAAAEKLGKNRTFLYVGDLPDDIRAVNEAKSQLSICSVGFPWYGSNPEGALRELEKVKPDFLLKKPGELPTFVYKKFKTA